MIQKCILKHLLSYFLQLHSITIHLILIVENCHDYLFHFTHNCSLSSVQLVSYCITNSQ